MSSTDQHAKVGELDALVCKDNQLCEDLISINPLLDVGFHLTMDADSGQLTNSETGASIRVTRQGAKWAVNLEDLASAVATQPDLESHPKVESLVQAHAVINRDNDSIRMKVVTLHERMGHPHAEAMCDALSGDSPSWIHCDVTPKQIRRVMKRHRCLICLLAKRPRPPIAPPSGDRKNIPPGYCLSGDIIPVSPAAHDGSTMYFLFADVRTGYMMAFTGKAKDAFTEAFKQAIAKMKRYGHEVKAFRSDAETVLKDGKMGDFLRDNGIIHELSTPEAHFQNFVERYVQTVTKFVGALLHGQDVLQSKHWDWALFHAVDCRNRVPNVKCKPSTPHELITGEKINLRKTFQFSFGDLVAVHTIKEKRNWKFDLRWDVGIYVGQPEHSVEAAMVYFPYRNQLLVRTDVIKLNIKDEAYKRYYHKRYDMSQSSTSTSSRIAARLEDAQFNFDDPLPEEENDSTHQEPTTIPLMEPEEAPEELRSSEPKRKKRTWDNLPSPSMTRSRTKAQAGVIHIFRVEIDDGETKAIKTFAARVSGPDVQEALASSIRDLWIMEMHREIVESMITSTRTLKPEKIDKSKPYHLIHTTMQLKVKMKTDTIVDKLKARLCACGNELEEVDSETYSPTVSGLTHSLMLQIAVHDRMHLQLIDTKSAYLCQSYPEDVTPLYVKIPKRVALALNLDPEETYRVMKYMYGLPDAGRAYYDAYSEHLMSNGFTRSVSDLCLFHKSGVHGRRVYAWIHVDDTLVAADDLDDIEEFKAMMQQRFEITVNELADQHLGVNIEHREDGSLKLTQLKLLNSILTEFDEEIKAAKGRHLVPFSPNRPAISDEPFDRMKYLHLLGMLNYLLRSRPDIATAVSYAATKASNPTRDDYGLLIDIIAYLKRTRDIGLIIHPGQPDQPLRLRCYVDASFLSHDDSRGHSGYCITIGNLSSFYSKSSKQQMVATSSTHAEVKALYQLVVDLILIINLCNEINRAIDLPIIIFEDNNPTVQMSTSLSARIKRSKHYLMLINFIRYYVTLGLIEVRKVATEDNLADVLTKPLAWKDFAPKAAKLLGMEVESFEDIS